MKTLYIIIFPAQLESAKVILNTFQGIWTSLCTFSMEVEKEDITACLDCLEYSLVNIKYEITIF
jgi:hypothetical protein